MSVGGRSIGYINSRLCCSAQPKILSPWTTPFPRSVQWCYCFEEFLWNSKLSSLNVRELCRAAFVACSTFLARKKTLILANRREWHKGRALSAVNRWRSSKTGINKLLFMDYSENIEPNRVTASLLFGPALRDRVNVPSSSSVGRRCSVMLRSI